MRARLMTYAVRQTHSRPLWHALQSGSLHAHALLQSVLLAVLIAAAATALLAWLPRVPEPIVVDADNSALFLGDGETAQLRNFSGFHGPESAGSLRFRWTTGQSS